MDPVDGVCGHVHGAVEAEGHIGSPDIVIDGLGKMDNVQSLFSQQVGRFLGAVSAQITRQSRRSL